MKLVGLIVVRNWIQLDYCVLEAARSLIPLCHKVVISDMESDDGSYEALKEFELTDSRLEVRSQPWENPHNDPTWWVHALNFARQTFVDSRDFLLQLDADEVLGREAWKGVKQSFDDRHARLFKRLNFWKDARHLAPPNRVCGTMVARMGPANLWLPSDEPNPLFRPNLRDKAEEGIDLHIYHYGFLRKHDAFLRKSEVVQNAFFGSVDPRISRAQTETGRWDGIDYFEGEPLEPFLGRHPPEAIGWLTERGHLA